ncbi:unnamed protein product [Heligmosomoides polygyrus]|uniref:BRCT domain-containing protein n=1 Tax=Heligmosomoides polygyrus TaxID=6339 RepID=A0A183FUA5_HELPZ|nr:unnamed protein product [Heligmosomoides polygyrus]
MTGVFRQPSGFKRGVVDVAKSLFGFRRRVTDVAPGVPDSHDVLTISRKPRLAREDMSPTWFIRCLGSEGVSLMSRKACPDSDDVLPVKVGPVMRER